MRKRIGIALIILIVAVMAGIIWLVLPDPEPSYQGKRFSAWLAQYAESTDGDASREKAEEAIRAIGTNGLPILVKWMSAKHWGAGDKLIALSRRQDLVRIPAHTGKEQRMSAASGFGILGPVAGPAVPALVDLLNDDRKSDGQRETVVALGAIGSASEAAVPAIIKCMNGTNYFAAFFAPKTLAAIHKKPELVVPALMQHLDESRRKPVHAERTIEAIGTFGNQATGAVTIIETFLNDRDESVRSAATNALKQINGEAATKGGIN